MNARTRTLLHIFLTGLVASGCATHLYVKSTPDKAKVELISLHTQSASALGETPLLLQKDDVTNIQIQGPYLIRISKDGFTPKEILLASFSGLEAEFNVELKSTGADKVSNELINGLFEAQTFAQKGQHQACLDKLADLEKKYPSVSAIYEMRGSLHLLQQDYPQARADLQRALLLDPDNRDLKNLVETASTRAGVPTERTPASVPKGTDSP